jgi:hypothetical protein
LAPLVPLAVRKIAFVRPVGVHVDTARSIFTLCDFGAAESNLFARNFEVLHDNQGSHVEELSVRLPIRYSADLSSYP